MRLYEYQERRIREFVLALKFGDLDGDTRIEATCFQDGRRLRVRVEPGDLYVEVYDAVHDHGVLTTAPAAETASWQVVHREEFLPQRAVEPAAGWPLPAVMKAWLAERNAIRCAHLIREEAQVLCNELAASGSIYATDGLRPAA